ncbi:probable RNA-binding protein 18 [Malaya genurostris]|uniref:probable RNA-binding protein 18 n=1 Tax=Malaya genurostris TaxID=325434 RepID=UPI0026F3CD4C|nr:probable RNA-binding protein 18 [Malaya genurostris]
MSELSVQDDRRLWIGNLDSRVTEYQLLKIAQKCGKIDKFDMLFHRSGPMAGYPRGYAFVTYERQKDSEAALEILNGKLVGDKHMVVRWAKNVNRDEMEKTKPKLQIPALAGGSKAGPSGPVSQQTKIQALEAKLKLMESRSDDLIINKSITNEKAIIEKYQFNKTQPHHQQHRMDSSKMKRNMNRGGRNGPYKSSRFK